MHLQNSPIHPQKSPVYQIKRIYVCASSQVSHELSHSRPCAHATVCSLTCAHAPMCSLTRAHTRTHPCALTLAPTHARTRVLFHARPRVHTCAHPRVCATSTLSLTITHPTHTRTYAQHTRELFIYKSWLSISARYVSRHTSSSI